MNLLGFMTVKESKPRRQKVTAVAIIGFRVNNISIRFNSENCHQLKSKERGTHDKMETKPN